jgi:thiosulfate/3-mercaptopyruvate sulfurtransferase
MEFKQPDYLVSTDWLAAHLTDPNLRIFDSTIHLPTSPGENVTAGRDDYARAHIPGAGFLDLLSDLSDTSSAFPFTRPPVDQLERVLSQAGIGNESRVVVYASSNVMWATRLWWLLRSAGHDRVAVLDGGFAKWCSDGHPSSAEPCGYPPSTFVAEMRESHWASKQDVQAAIGDGSICTINALPSALHTGDAEMGYARPGHIEGSENMPFHLLLDSETGEIKSAAELREHFARTGVFERERVINYCGGGIAATLNALALTLAGHPSVAVYDGSLNEWSADAELPMTTGTSR